MTDLNTLFAHTRIDILDMIDSAIDAGMIYNVDYKDVKEAANRKLEEGYKNAVTKPYLEGLHNRGEEISPEMSEILYYSGYPQAHTLNARDKGITKLEKTDPDHWMVKAAREYLELVRPVIEKLVIIKGTVVKGRKPSTTPRLTPERTLENTGTCAVCGRNVKLKEGKIVDHGYTIRYGFQSGNCAGVNFDPIEISPKGAEAYLNALIAYKENLEEKLPKATAEKTRLLQEVKACDNTDATLRKQFSEASNNERRIESELRYVPRDIKMFTTIVIEWVAKPLPKA